MIVRFLLAVVFLATVTGCATSGVKVTQEQLQSRVTELEKKIEEKDSEIVDLQYQVKDISGKVNSGDSSDSSDDSLDKMAVDSYSKSNSKSVDEIIRVNANIQDIQTALKNAGVYSGKIDGKVGSGTKQAIMQFQKDQHLTADGILGKRTWKLLKSYLKD